MDVNVQNETGESALHLLKDITLAKYLIARGANVNLPDGQSGMTPLFFQEVAVARLLIAAGANVNCLTHAADGSDPINAMPQLTGLPVRIARATAENLTEEMSA